MARNRSKVKSRSDGSDGSGGFGALYRHIWQHPDYCQLSGNAVKLLMDFACQYNGKNNGDLTNALSVLRLRGWRSRGTLQRATSELLEAGLIIQTREGRFTNPGGICALYALSWHPIDECPGKRLSVEPSVTPPRKFSLEINKTPCPEVGQGPVHKRYRSRVRDANGKYLSVHKRDRLMVVT